MNVSQNLLHEYISYISMPHNPITVKWDPCFIFSDEQLKPGRSLVNKRVFHPEYNILQIYTVISARMIGTCVSCVKASWW